jgi:hypothetical protein
MFAATFADRSAACPMGAGLPASDPSRGNAAAPLRDIRCGERACQPQTARPHCALELSPVGGDA